MIGRSARRIGGASLLAAWAAAGGALAGDAASERVVHADLNVALTARLDPVVAGDVQLLAVGVANRGPSRATGVTLQQELPAGAALLGVEPRSVACLAIADVLLECDLGELAPGERLDLTVGLLVDPRADGAWTAAVAVAGDQPDPEIRNDQAELETRVTPAREMLATHRGGSDALAIGLKEGSTSVSLAFADPTGSDRAYSVEAIGFRGAAMAEIPSFGASASPEIAVLAAGFDGETHLLVIDAADRTLLGRHAVDGDWQPIDVVALSSFAATPAAELALLLRDRSGDQVRLRVLDAASGRVVRDLRLATDAVDRDGAPIVAPQPVAMVALGDPNGTELAILSKSPGTGEVRVVLVDIDAGEMSADHLLPPDLFPLGLVAVGDLGLPSGTAAPDVAALVRAVDGDLFAIVLDSENGALFGPIDFDDSLEPGAFDVIPSFGDTSAPVLAVTGRVDPDTLVVVLKDAATGGSVDAVAFSTESGVPVPLALEVLDGLEGEREPALAVLFEPFGEPARVRLVRLGAPAESAEFALP